MLVFPRNIVLLKNITGNSCYQELLKKVISNNFGSTTPETLILKKI